MAIESDVEETTQIATSAELMAAVTNDTLDLDNSLVAGQTGGEITISKSSRLQFQQILILAFIVQFLKFIFA